MTAWSEPEVCALCHAKGERMHIRLVEWLDAPPGMTYEQVARCDDRAACRARVEAAGETWPVAERAA